MYNFDEIVDRKKSYSLRWDGIEERYGINDNELLPLWVADMEFKAAPAITESILERARHGIFGYTGGYHDEYQTVIKDWFGRRHNTDINKNWVMISDTVVGTLSRIIRSFTNKGDGIIIQTPVFPRFHELIENNERVIVDNPLKFDGKKYVMDLEDLERKIDEKAKMIILCNPHNPVGRVWTREELSELGKICIRHNILIVSDEVHSDIVFSGYKHTTLLGISDEISNNCIVCISPHKSFNLAGLQISSTIIPDRKLREKYNNVLIAEGIIKPNIFGLVASIAAYRHGEEWLDELLIYLENNLDFMEAYISNMIPEMNFVRPEGTFLAWMDIRAMKYSDNEIENLIFNKAKLVLNMGPTFGKNGSGFARLNFACPKTVLAQGLTRLANTVKAAK